MSYFESVFRQVNPDIVLCQEIATEEGADSILSTLNNALGGFAQSDFIYDSNYNNMLYYKTSLGTLISQDTILVYPRAISEYVMVIGGNTIRFYDCHLKAATGTQNQADRLAAVTALRNHINSLAEGTEFIIVGDMNFYTSSEPGYQKFIVDQGDNSRSQDLCLEVGEWNNNASFSSVHTQSTRYEAYGGGASGGLDDKFDFIFSSYTLNNGSEIEYITNSFTVFGNDGYHFNQSVNEGTNYAVPDSIADALYEASDHLPIYADFSNISGVQTYLVLSEYIEGTSYSKAIEIYNGTGATVDLASYSLEKDVNGNNDWGNTYTYNGTLAVGDVFVLAHPSADSAILNIADDTHGGVINFNGNDQVRLCKNGIEVDRIGIPGDVLFGQDVTYVRKSMITTPQSGPQDPRTNGEWDEYPVDTFTYLGTHTAINPTITVISPNGNEEWDRGNSYDITWTSNDFTDDVKIELFQLNSEDYSVLISSTDNDGSWQWYIPSEQVIAYDYKIRISDANDGSPYDESDAYFSIVGDQIANDLFISEYIEGSSYNKAIEIYNGTGASVDLSEYRIALYSNGAANPSYTLGLSGTLANGEVCVCAHSSADPAILAVTDLISSSVINFNGDDHISLQYLDGTSIDGIGISGIDPGIGWDVAGVTNATLNHTLVRKSSIVEGNTDWTSSAGTNEDNSEWIVHDVDTFEYLGYHCPEPLNKPESVHISANASTVTLTWDAVSGATAYKVYSSDNPFTGFTENTAGTYDGTSWTAPLPGTKKFYYVKAVN